MGHDMTVERLRDRITQSYESAVRCVVSPGDHQIVTCELMVHPGYRCQGLGGCGGPDSADEFACSVEREHELAVVNSHELQCFYSEFKLELTSQL
jgi:hypothetical protein